MEDDQGRQHGILRKSGTRNKGTSMEWTKSRKTINLTGLNWIGSNTGGNLEIKENREITIIHKTTWYTTHLVIIFLHQPYSSQNKYLAKYSIQNFHCIIAKYNLSSRSYKLPQCSFTLWSVQQYDSLIHLISLPPVCHPVPETQACSQQ